MLAAARELLARDPRGTMEDIARAAGVGKGTLYRRYPDRTALVMALLDDHERRLQDRLVSDAPPLGPGAPPDERLRAFYAAYLELLDAVGRISLAVESTAARLTTGAHAAWRLHVATLVREANVAADADVLAEQLLAPLAPELHVFEREVLGRTTEQRLAALSVLAGILDPGTGGGKHPRRSNRAR